MRDFDTTIKNSKQYQFSKDEEEASISSKEERITSDLSNKESMTREKDKFQNSNDKLTLGSLDKLSGLINFKKKDAQKKENGRFEHNETENTGIVMIVLGILKI